MKRILGKAVAPLLMMLSLAVVGAAADQMVPRVSIDVSGHPFKGPADAPVTIVDFFDYL